MPTLEEITLTPEQMALMEAMIKDTEELGITPIKRLVRFQKHAKLIWKAGAAWQRGQIIGLIRDMPKHTSLIDLLFGLLIQEIKQSCDDSHVTDKSGAMSQPKTHEISCDKEKP